MNVAVFIVWTVYCSPHWSIRSVITRLRPEAAAFKAILHPPSLYCGIMIAMTTIT